MTQKVLVLGAGFVTKPTVQILSDSGIHVTVACRTLETAKRLSSGIKNTTAISLDAQNASALEAEVAKNDLVVSLIPYIYHADVIEAAIKQKKNVVTTSYVSPAMLALDARAKEAGITVLNEIGLDPGIDHLYAIKTIDEVHKAGGKITSFLSYCGGLPAPEFSDNPLGYKFSWSARGALLALLNHAKHWEGGKIQETPGKDLMNIAKPIFIYPGYALVGYPNRDSTPYNERYNIPEAKEILRGTLRYQGFPEFAKAIVDIGFLDIEKKEYLTSSMPWNEATAKIIGASSSSEADITKTILSKAKFSSPSEQARILAGLRWIGIYSTDPITPAGTPLDVLCAVLEKKMAYSKGERDFVILQHKFEVENADGSHETRTSTLAEYGAPYATEPQGYSAMEKLVGVPCAVGVKCVLDGRIAEKGILAPMDPKMCTILRDELKKVYGIELVEKTIAH